MKYLSLLLFVFLTGCALTEKPNNATAFTSDQIVNLAVQVERAQAGGALSEEKGDEFLTLLLKANSLLQGGSVLYSDIELCSAAPTKFQCIDKVLSTVEGAL